MRNPFKKYYFIQYDVYQNNGRTTLHQCGHYGFWVWVSPERIWDFINAKIFNEMNDGDSLTVINFYRVY